MKKQTAKDKKDESRGEKFRKVIEKDRARNKSAKHRSAESRGMKKAMRKKKK